MGCFVDRWGNQGQGKILFLRHGKLCFDIGFFGLITGKSNVADGKEHDIGLSYDINENKFHLIVDG